ncbi:STAS domain-containing protein [Lacibacterium aquatile]|uniref:Anti-sigma factor antagonist n=1 Tax=Lacibacterium aquatile TaxID=1168082 RepID=A0ABW5DQF7_9PROT
MNHAVTVANDAAEITITGRLTFKFHKEYKDFLDDLLKNEVERFIFDLSGVEFIDSAGLGMLLIAKQKAQGQNAQVILRKPPENVKRMLQVAKFDKIFEIEA